MALIFLKPDWPWLTMALVWLGFIVSLTGSYLGDRFVGPNSHHRRVPAALKGFDDSYVLLMYRLAAPFVLVEPGGVTVLTVKSQSGGVSFENGRWRHHQTMGFLRRFAGQEGLGQPHRVAQVEQDFVTELIAKSMPEGTEIPTRAIILFSNPDVELNVDEDAVPLPAVRAAELKRWLRRNPLKPQLPDDVYSELLQLLGVEAEAEANVA
jgi:hypothetical protein